MVDCGLERRLWLVVARSCGCLFFSRMFVTHKAWLWLGCAFGYLNFFLPQGLFISHMISCHMIFLTCITRDVYRIAETCIVVGSCGCCCVVVVFKGVGVTVGVLDIGLVIWILWGVMITLCLMQKFRDIQI